MRTTLDIDKPVLDELKRLSKKQKKTAGKIASELLARSLKELQQKQSPLPTAELNWNTKPMGTRVDIEDKEALYAVLNRDE